jgi:hypothetical protein
MTPFCFEHDFVAPSTTAVFAAYFDAAHQLEQDRALEISEREVLELDDRGDELHRLSRIVPRRQLPAFLRPLTAGPLHYIERAIWQRSAERISIELRPSLLRTKISATYSLQRVFPGSVRRRYAGDVSVDVALVASRIERNIVAEFERSLPIAAACTQSWLDRQTSRSVTARA